MDVCKNMVSGFSKRFVITLTILTVFGSYGFAEPQDHGIRRRTKPKEESTRRPIKPKSEDVGLSGELIWVNDRLTLQTPSGKQYELSSKEEELQKKLLDVSEKKNTSVELSGTLSEGKFKVKNIESTFINEGIIKSEFIIGYSENLSPDDQKKIESKLEDISGVKLEQVSSVFPFIIIKTDLSMAHLKSKFNDNDFLKKHINKVTRAKETAIEVLSR